MSSLNQVNLIGRLGQDPEVRHFSNGSSVTNLSLATSEHWKDEKGIKRERTEWHRVSLFGREGEVAAEYLRKGSLVFISGSIRTNKYTDNNGVERYSTEIRASNMRMLGNSDNSKASPPSAPKPQTKPPAPKPVTKPTTPPPPATDVSDAVADCDIPF